MGVIKVETFDTDVALTTTTGTLTNDVGSLNSAFVRRTTSIDKQTGLIGNTGNIEPDDSTAAVYLSGTDELTFVQPTALNRKIVGEVWRYTGAASGLDEFIVRGRYQISLNAAAATGSISTSGIVDEDKCIPFCTGMTSDATSVNDFDSSTVSIYIDSSGNIQCERGATTGNLVVYVTVVEFTGSNWSVGHGRSASHDTTTENVTLNTASDGQSGSTFDVGSWGSAMIIEGSLEGDTSETGLSDNLGCWVPGSNTTTANFILQQDSNARNDGVAYCHVLAHSSMIIARGSDTNYGEGNNTYANVSVPSGIGILTLDEMSLEWFSDTSGVGTAHSRGRLSARITSTTNIQNWVHRSGNNVRIDYGVANLSSINGFAAVTIDTAPSQVDNGDTGLVITGSNFEAVQGTGNVYLSDTSTLGSGTDVAQTINSWSDTSINFDLVTTGIPDGIVYLIIQNDSGGSASKSSAKGFLGYTDVLLNMPTPPDHYHTFDNTYADSSGALAANGQASAGSFGFVTNPLTRDRTHSWTVNDAASRIEMADSAFTNVTNTHRRRFIGGWIRFDAIPLDPKGIWEEGGNVNNIYIVIGFGGKILVNAADSNKNFKCQGFSDFLLTPNRTYHVGVLFGDAGYEDGVVCYIDGVAQSGRAGDANGVTNGQSTHSGDYAYGQPDGSLDTGGTDITYPSFANTLYNDWATWSLVGGGIPTDTDLRVEVFEKGAVEEIEIVSDTPANMQLAIDALSGNNYDDVTFAIKINRASDNSSFSLDFDNITFGDRTSIQVQFMGKTETLTINNLNGSNTDSSKSSTPYGGSITIVNSANLNLSGLQTGSEVRVYTAGTQTELAGVENSGTTFSYNYLYTGDFNVDIVIHSLGYQYQKIENITLSSTDTNLPIQQRVDRNYLNP